MSQTKGVEGIKKYYTATVKYLIEQETATGKIKFTTKRDQYLVNANTIQDVDKTLKALLGGVYDSFEVVSIRESNIVAVIDEIKSI